MRATAEDLIAELDHEATEHFYVAMAVGFEDSTVFIDSNEENRLSVLNSGIQLGGIPVGLIAADKIDNQLVMRVRCFSEQPDSKEFDARGYLVELTNQIREHLLSQENPSSTK